MLAWENEFPRAHHQNMQSEILQETKEHVTATARKQNSESEFTCLPALPLTLQKENTT